MSKERGEKKILLFNDRRRKKTLFEEGVVVDRDFNCGRAGGKPPMGSKRFLMARSIGPHLVSLLTLSIGSSLCLCDNRRGKIPQGDTRKIYALRAVRKKKVLFLNANKHWKFSGGKPISCDNYIVMSYSL